MKTKEIIREFYEDVVTNNQLECIGDYISPACRVRVGSETFPMGVAGMKKHIMATKATYPDYTMHILRQFQDGDTVISEFIMIGTHRGVYLGIAPTGKTVSIFGVDIDKVADGKIIEHGGAANTFEAFWENGLVKPVGSGDVETWISKSLPTTTWRKRFSWWLRFSWNLKRRIIPRKGCRRFLPQLCMIQTT